MKERKIPFNTEEIGLML
ncbi:hypothetical protein RDI58_019710 [Solanum bulbocastanum]|uniref:Uncharacterized protein n=1 Tax=Solanum bulbocastanum TaxID=147425 RepID=A0AAN8Y778_SOLBU